MHHIRGLYHRLTRKGSRKGLVFHHIPKTAGTTVSSELRRVTPLLKWGPISSKSTDAVIRRVSGESPEDRVTSLDDTDMQYRIQEYRRHILLYHLMQEKQLINGHVFYDEAFRQAFEAEYCFVSLLRQPVERLVSHYFYNRYQARHVDFPAFEDYLATPRAEFVANLQVVFLAGWGYRDASWSDRLAAAQKHAQSISYLGAVDRLGQFADYLSSQIDRPVSFKQARKKGKSPTEATDILSNAVLRDRMERLCQYDIELYDHGLRLA